MKIFVKVKPRAKENKVEKVDEKTFLIWTKEPALKGRANRVVLKLLADYFNIPGSGLRIKSGLKSKQKIIEIID